MITKQEKKPTNNLDVMKDVRKNQESFRTHEKKKLNETLQS